MNKPKFKIGDLVICYVSLDDWEIFKITDIKRHYEEFHYNTNCYYPFGRKFYREEELRLVNEKLLNDLYGEKEV